MAAAEKALIAANWKMNPTDGGAALELVKAILPVASANVDQVEVALFPLLAWLLHDYGEAPLMLLMMALASALIVARHYQNIHRLLAGAEPRFQWRRG